MLSIAPCSSNERTFGKDAVRCCDSKSLAFYSEFIVASESIRAIGCGTVIPIRCPVQGEQKRCGTAYFFVRHETTTFLSLWASPSENHAPISENPAPNVENPAQHNFIAFRSIPAIGG
jgi:hypothetical protein